ncbi:major facilitator superfamily domain-containing protein 12-like [Ornithodoros turicata]|uniref:major facilitator superfamily domain-containing protein 12-like n=1 Tax=Ornithodoros turicata TaxID=34597 RepID=UPI0031396113
MEASGSYEKITEASRSFRPTHVLSLRTRLAYSVGHVLNDLCASMWFTYLLLYFIMVLEFKNTLAGALMLVGQIADGLATPFVGIESDRDDNFWMCRYGRRKTWHLVGTLCVVGSFPFLFTRCVSCTEAAQTSQFVYYAAFIIIFQFGWAATQVSHLSLIPDLTPISHERVELNTLRYAFTVASNIVVYSVMWAVLGLAGDNTSSGKSTSSGDPSSPRGGETKVGPVDAHVFQKVVFIVVGLGAVFSLLFHLLVRDPSVTRRNSGLLGRNEYLKTLVLDKSKHLRWKDWFRHGNFYLVGLLYMATRLYVNLSQVFITMYLQSTLRLHRQTIAIIPLVMYVSGFFSSFTMKFASKRIGIKNVYITGAILGIIGSVWISFGNECLRYTHYEIYAIAVLIGMAGTTMLVTSLSLTNDLIGGHTSSGAFVFGAMSFLDKLANGIAVIVIEDVCSKLNCKNEDMKYYQYVMVYACGGAAAFGLMFSLCLCWVKDLSAPAQNGPPELPPSREGDINGDDDDAPLLGESSTASNIVA